MTLPRTVAEVFSRHVTFEVESIDRMYLNVYQPRLQYTAGAAAFFVGHRGFSYASSALMAQMTEHRIRHVPVVADGKLTGIISIGDVVKNRIGELEFERDQLDSYVHQT